MVFENLFNKYRKEIVHSRLLMVEGKLQKEGIVIHVVVQRCYDLSLLLLPVQQNQSKNDADLTSGENQFDPEVPHSKKKTAKNLQTDIFHGGRNFR